MKLLIEIVQSERGVAPHAQLERVWDLRLATTHEDGRKGWEVLKRFRWSDARADYNAVLTGMSYAIFLQCPIRFRDEGSDLAQIMKSVPLVGPIKQFEITGWRVVVRSSLDRQFPGGRPMGERIEGTETLVPMWYTTYLVKETTEGDQKIEWNTNYSEGRGHQSLEARVRSDADMLALKFGCMLHFCDEEPYDAAEKWSKMFDRIKREKDSDSEE